MSWDCILLGIYPRPLPTNTEEGREEQKRSAREKPKKMMSGIDVVHEELVLSV